MTAIAPEMIQRVMPLFVAFFVLVSASIGYALTKGGPSERAAALVTLTGVSISPAVAHAGPELWHGSETGVLIVDTAALLAYGIIMVWSRRFWPIWTAAFQLLTVAAHLGPLFRRNRIALPFAFDEEIWSWAILAQLIIVTWLRSRFQPRSLR